MCECECCGCFEETCECCSAKCATTCSIITTIISAIILIVVLVATSVKKLEAYEVGLEFDPNSVTINTEKLFTEGTHSLGPGHYFITFNRQLRTIQMGSSAKQGSNPDMKDDPLLCRTKDALQVQIECSFQYQLSIDKDDLIQLYSDWGENYETAFLLAARNVLRDIMGEFWALQVFYERSTIESALRIGLTEKLREYKVILQSFQLLDIDLPQKFNQALIDTENLNLNITTVTY